MTRDELLASAVFCVASLQTAQAVTLPAEERPAPKATHNAWTFDSTLEANSLRGSSLDLNVTLAPFGSIYENGLRMRASIGGVGYRYAADAESDVLAKGTGRDFGLFAGYGLVIPRATIVGLIGRVWGDSRDSGSESSFHGYKGVVTVFARPDEHNMVYGLFTRSTMQRGSNQVIGKWGYRTGAGPYFGPELNLTWRSASSLQSRPVVFKAGAHLSALPVGPGFLSVGIGRYAERAAGIGTYLSVNIYSVF